MPSEIFTHLAGVVGMIITLASFLHHYPSLFIRAAKAARSNNQCLAILVVFIKRCGNDFATGPCCKVALLYLVVQDCVIGSFFKVLRCSDLLLARDDNPLR